MKYSGLVFLCPSLIKHSLSPDPSLLQPFGPSKTAGVEGEAAGQLAGTILQGQGGKGFSLSGGDKTMP